MSRQKNDDIRPEWKGSLLTATLGGGLFLAVTGVAVFLSPESSGGQFALLAHAAGGILLIVPTSLYLWRHVAARWRSPLSHRLVLGWLSGAVLAGTFLSGAVGTWQAAFGRRIEPLWDFVHLVTGLSVAALLIAHLATAVRRASGEPRALQRLLAGWTVGSAAAVAGLFAAGAARPEAALRRPLPEGYAYRYGENPFAPSRARTDWQRQVDHDRRVLYELEGSGAPAEALHDARLALAASEVRFREAGGFAPEALSGSQGCGDAGCHTEILAEWEPSAHRYAARSAFFQLIQGMMAESNGAESTRYCAGCHDPISLFSGAKNVFHDDLSSPGADEGVSCASCHRITSTDVHGNAHYVVAPPERYVGEGTFVGRFLIRAAPRKHKAEYGRPLQQTPEFCGACHKQFIDEEINRATRVQLQNQYDGWKESHWADEGLSCRDCHMRLVPSGEPAGEDGKHRHHGFVAANQWLPLLHELPHAEKHVKLTEEWLRGETVVEEIADRWPEGPIVPIRIVAPESAEPGARVALRVVAENAKVGHTFPTGPLDVIQAWVEVRVMHGDRTVFRSGRLDDDGFLDPASWMFKAEGVDRAGNLIDRHNLWDMVGSRFRRVLFPGYTDRQDYEFSWDCERPGGIAGSEVSFEAPAESGELVVSAVLRYRKVDQTLLNVLRPDGKARAPVTDMSRAEARIRVKAK